MMIVKEFDAADLNLQCLRDWNYVLSNNNDSTIFQTPEWIELTIKWTSSSGKLIIAYMDDSPIGVFYYYSKVFKQFLKKAYTENFESPYGGPIILERADINTIDFMIKHVEKKIQLASISVTLPPLACIQPFLENKFDKLGKQTMILPLDKTEEVLFDQMHKMKRRNIRKAEKNDIEIVHEDSSALDIYHNMLAATYKRLSLKPPMPIEYYQDIFNVFGENKRIVLSMAYKDSEPIASALFLVYKGTTIFWQGASYQEYMKYGANDLIHWDIIKYSLNKNNAHYNLLHFHDDIGLELESLKRFKEGFGATCATYHVMKKESRILNVSKGIFNNATS